MFKRRSAKAGSKACVGNSRCRLKRVSRPAVFLAPSPAQTEEPMIREPNQTQTPDEPDPAGATIHSLQNWPDSELFRLARGLAGELTRRQLPTPAALPVAQATYAAIGTP